MLKVKIEKWNHTPELLRAEALSASHPRTRERLLALYDITQGVNATQVAQRTHRNPQTVMGWVHQYNDSGLNALVYRHTGGHPPLCLVRLKQG